MRLHAVPVLSPYAYQEALSLVQVLSRKTWAARPSPWPSSRPTGPARACPPDHPPPSPPAKPKLTPEERRTRYADRLASIRLRMAIGHELDDKGITEPAEIGAALGLPAVEATKLLTRHQWREGDVARLQAAAARLGLGLGLSV